VGKRTKRKEVFGQFNKKKKKQDALSGEGEMVVQKLHRKRGSFSGGGRSPKGGDHL